MSPLQTELTEEFPCLAAEFSVGTGPSPQKRLKESSKIFLKTIYGRARE